jgi:hypothetical protein
MTQTAKNMMVMLVSSLRSDIGIPAEHAISAVLMGVQKMGLGTQDAREMLDWLRNEWGMSAKDWAKIVVKQLKEFPQAPTNTIIELQKPV